MIDINKILAILIIGIILFRLGWAIYKCWPFIWRRYNMWLDQYCVKKNGRPPVL